MNLFHYLDDGANYQARAVLAYLQGYGAIEESWNEDTLHYEADPRIARWENCREQGYVIYMHAQNYKQINIAFFEHRNSDSICAVIWEQETINAPTIQTAEFGQIYKDKFDVSHSTSHGNAEEMANWIFEQLVTFWVENKRIIPYASA